jgi:hypothetical protein
MLFEQVNIVPSVKAHRLGKTKGVPTFVANTKLGTGTYKKIMQMVYTFTKINNLNLFLLIQTHKKGMLCV